ncbi:MAG: hypothetical protein IPF82_20315 [Blastocatellia bacterium]|jgi:chromosome segregation ATPase|nr:hypothetical protein [Blastocatellia bacterium]
MPIAGALALALAISVAPIAGASQEGESSMPRSIQLRDAIVDLTAEVRSLRAEIQRQQANDPIKFNITASKYQLVLVDIQRLKGEEKEIIERLSYVRSRELDAQNRLANIQVELVALADINRSDAEARLRRAFTQQLSVARDELATLQSRLLAVREKLERTEAVAEALRKKLKIHPSQLDEIEREVTSPVP